MKAVVKKLRHRPVGRMKRLPERPREGGERRAEKRKRRCIQRCNEAMQKMACEVICSPKAIQSFEGIIGYPGLKRSDREIKRFITQTSKVNSLAAGDPRLLLGIVNGKCSQGFGYAAQPASLPEHRKKENCSVTGIFRYPAAPVEKEKAF